MKNIDKLVEVDKAIDKARKKQTLDSLEKAVRVILTNSWNDAVRESLITILNQIDKIHGPVTREELVRIEKQVEKALGSTLSIVEKKQLITLHEAIYTLGMDSAVDVGAKIIFGLADQKSIDVLSEDLFYWVGSYYDDNLQDDFKKELKEFFDGGSDREELKRILRENMTSKVGEKSDSYWSLLADHVATKTREIGRVSGYEQALIKVVRVVARIDDRTTEFCLRINNHVISVEVLRKFTNNYLKTTKTKDKEKIKKAWPWWSDKETKKRLNSTRDVNRYIKKGKIGLPPYHGRCRTITVAEFVSEAGTRVED